MNKTKIKNYFIIVISCFVRTFLSIRDSNLGGDDHHQPKNFYFLMLQIMVKG